MNRPAHSETAPNGTSFAVAVLAREGASPWDVLECHGVQARCVGFDDVSKCIVRMAHEERSVFLVDSHLVQEQGATCVHAIANSSLGPVLYLTGEGAAAESALESGASVVLPRSFLELEESLVLAVLDRALQGWEAERRAEDADQASDDLREQLGVRRLEGRERLADVDRTVRDSLMELRSALAPVIGFSELLLDERDGGLDSQQADYLGHVLESANRIMQLLDDLRHSMLVACGALQPEAALHELHEVIDTVCRSTTDRVSVEVRVDPGAERSWFDFGQVATVLSRLLQFAAERSVRGAQVGLAARRLGEEVELSVRFGGDILVLLALVFQGAPGADASCELPAGMGGSGLDLARRLVTSWGGALEVRAPGTQEVILAFRLPVDHPRRLRAL